MGKVLKSKFLWTVISIALFLFIVFSLMPKPIDSDLEQIGNGKKSLVFVYDLNLAVSNPQTVEMNEALATLGDQVNILIAKSGDPQGNAFKEKYQAPSASLLFFDESGKVIDRKMAVVSSEELTRKLSLK